MRTCVCGSEVAVDEPICPRCAKPVRSLGRFGASIIVVRAVLCALLLAVVSGYWWLLLSVPTSHPLQATNESAAVENLHTIAMAELALLSSKGRYGSIEELIAANLLSTRFTNSVGGYGFTVVVSGSSDYKATANPTTTNEGRYGFYIRASEGAIVRYSDDPALAPVGLAGKEIQ
jgi:hypothetical protein